MPNFPRKPMKNYLKPSRVPLVDREHVLGRTDPARQGKDLLFPP